jgi:hypothetical protein
MHFSVRIPTVEVQVFWGHFLGIILALNLASKLGAPPVHRITQSVYGFVRRLSTKAWKYSCKGGFERLGNKDDIATMIGSSLQIFIASSRVHGKRPANRLSERIF